MQRATAVSFFIFLSLLSALPTAAQSLPLHKDVVQFTLRDDLYIAGSAVTVAEAVQGDVIGAGRTVRIEKNVGGDLWIAGETVTIVGNVRDDVRIAGGNVTILGDVGGDVLLFGGHLLIDKGAAVSGNVVAAGGSIAIEGRIGGSLTTRGSDVSLIGSVAGPADIRSERLNLSGTMRRGGVLAAQQWYIGDRAQIFGELRYWQPQGERTFTNVLTGQATFDPTLTIEGTDKLAAGAVTMLETIVTAFSLFSGALVIGLLLLGTKTFFRDAAKKLQAAPGRCLLLGLLYFLLMPVLVLIFIGTLIGIPIGLLLLLGYIFSIVFSKPLTAIVLAKWVEGTYRKRLHGGILFLLSIVIFLLLKLLFVLPFFGWLILVFAICLSFGALLQTKYERFLKIR